MAIGAYVKAKRTSLGMTLDEVAEAIGTSKSFVHELENDKYGISFVNAIKLSVALNIPINVLAAVAIKDTK